MKRFHLFSSFTLLVGLVIYSCSKDESQMPDDSRLSLNEIKAVGEEHNHYVLEGFQNFDFLARDKEQALIMSFLEFSPNLRSEELSLILNLGEKGFDPKLNGKTFQNRLTLELYNQLVALSNQEIEHYSVFEKDVNNIKSRVMDNLKGMDREFMLISIEVALNSANLWLPTNKGGQGLYDKLNPKLSSAGQIQFRSDCSDSIIAGDIGGAAGVFFGWGFTLVAIPGTNAAVATAVAWGAAYGSAMGAIRGCR